MSTSIARNQGEAGVDETPVKIRPGLEKVVHRRDQKKQGQRSNRQDVVGLDNWPKAE